ncbi:MAG: phenylalanine--tRNA ligase subunit beta [Synergistaceae bacterium]|jgi:phenylalanyl-tRNA synthetase beta chain|nr:phenylalanine--tRNA ligase subunit beta [Synergistaceae bacterium]
MLVSWGILKRFIDLSVSPEEAAERLTMSGAEVESISRPGAKLSGIRAARVLSLEGHPTRSGLFVAKLDTGRGEAACVTAATNLEAGDKVFYGSPGAVLADGTELGLRDFDGVRSAGMMLSAAEMGLPDVDVTEGILVLPGDAPVGADALSLYGFADTLLDISVTPNRGDLLSALGVARELKGLFPDSVLKSMPWDEDLSGTAEWPVEFGEIALPDPGCLNYHLGLATEVRIGPSPVEIRVALSHLGMRPVSNIVDVTNYVMLTLGQPLHAFDLNTLPKREITVRAAADGESILTLDGKERVLTSRDMLITSGKGPASEPIALAGIMGGEQTGINADTSVVVLEGASFSALRVGHTSRRLGITSEAAFRYSRGVDPSLSATGVDYALTLMRGWSGAKIGYKRNCALNARPEPSPVLLTKEKLQTYLLWSDMEESTKILEGFGIRHKKDYQGERFGENIRAFAPPTWRPDITIEEDLIEEIGRWRGYNDAPDILPGELPRRASVGEETSLAGVLRAAAIARGYVEAITYSFLPDSFPSALRLPESDIRARPLLLANPISQDWIAMRTTLIPGLLNGLRESVASGWRGPVRLFEIGRVFLESDAAARAQKQEKAPDRAPAGHTEPDYLAALVYGGVDPRSLWGGDDFLSVKADVEALLRVGGRSPVFERGSEPFAHAGQCASVLVRGEKTGCLARLSPAIERELGIAEAVYVFELNLSSLGEAEKPVYAPAAPFPAVFRDISMLVPGDAAAEGISAEIRAIASELFASGKIPDGFLESVTLFDLYGGKGIPEGRVSMAFSLCYRASARTLNDEEVDGIHNSLRDALTRKGYPMR